MLFVRNQSRIKQTKGCDGDFESVERKRQTSSDYYYQIIYWIGFSSV